MRNKTVLSLLFAGALASCSSQPDATVGTSDTGAVSDTAVKPLDGGTEPVPDAGSGSVDSGAPDAAQPVVDMGPPPPPPPKAFPSAFGGGASATGGRGGILVIVDTDDPNAPLEHFPATAETPERYEGGLFGALQLDEPAYIVFDRSMNIDIGRGGTSARFGYDGIPDVRNKTIFGQSAPRGGVTVTGGTFRFDGRNSEISNLIFRHLRSRPLYNRDGVVSTDDDSYTWGMLFYGGNDVVVDHCSFSFAQDKALGAYVDQQVVPEHDLRRFTFSRNFVNDSHTGTYVEINPGRPEDPEEYVDQISFIGNLQIGINRSPNVAFDGFAEILNTVVYGQHYKSSTIYHDIQLNHVGNYYDRPNADNSGFNRVFQHEGDPRIFTAGNYFSGILDGEPGEDNKAVWKYRDEYDSMIGAEFFVDAPFEGSIEHAYAPVSAAEAYDSVVTDGDVGAHRYLDDDGEPATYRDPYDAQMLEVARTRASFSPRQVENWVLPEIPMTQRPADYDTDRDGMADAWERRVFGDLSQSYDGDHDGDGYTNIEEFMNQVDVP